MKENVEIIFQILKNIGRNFVLFENIFHANARKKYRKPCHRLVKRSIGISVKHVSEGDMEGYLPKCSALLKYIIIHCNDCNTLLKEVRFVVYRN